MTVTMTAAASRYARFDAARRRPTARWVLPLLLAAILAVTEALLAPHTADLAAQTARARLVDRSGLVPYWVGWYGGIATAGYSLVGGLALHGFGAVGSCVVAVVLTAPIASALLRDAPRPTAGACALVATTGLDAFSGRSTFALGAVAALLSVLAVERRWCLPAVAAGALATAISPVAGLLLLPVAATQVLFGRARAGVAAGAGVAAVLAVVAALSHGDGTGVEPFSAASLLIAVLTTLVVLLSPVSARLRVGAVLTLGALVVVYAIASPVGANVTRLPVLVAAPVVVAGARWRSWGLPVAIVAAAALPVCQTVNDLRAAASTPPAASLAALRVQLVGDPGMGDGRVELVDTATHWGDAVLPGTVSLARGWERQTDEGRNPLFYASSGLTAASYRAFLDEQAVSRVVLPTRAPLDKAATAEGALVAAGLPYLRLSWQDADWRVYDVLEPRPLVSEPANAVVQTDTGLRFRAPSPGLYRVALRWSPYLAVTGATLQPAGASAVTLTVTRAGEVDVRSRWRWP